MDPNSQTPQVETTPQTPVTPPVMEVAAPIPESPPQPIPVETTPPIVETPDGKKNSPILIVAVVLAVIAVLAVVAYAVAGKLLNPQPTATVAPVVSTPTPTPDPTADWKTYTNTKFGFSFKYPSDFSYITDTTDTIFDDGINNSMILVQNYNGLTEQGNKPTDFQLMVLIANTKGQFNMEDISSPSAEMFGEVAASRGTTTIKMETVPVVILNTSPHKIAFILTTPKSTESAVFDQILSTFKFLTVIPSASPIVIPIVIPTTSPSATP